MEEVPVIHEATLDRELAERHRAAGCWPERLELMPALPMTPSGKVQTYQLLEQVRGVPPSKKQSPNKRSRPNAIVNEWVVA